MKQIVRFHQTTLFRKKKSCLQGTKHSKRPSERNQVEPIFPQQSDVQNLNFFPIKNQFETLESKPDMIFYSKKNRITTQFFTQAKSHTNFDPSSLLAWKCASKISLSRTIAVAARPYFSANCACPRRVNQPCQPVVCLISACPRRVARHLNRILKSLYRLQ